MINSQCELGEINPAINRHLELEIKTLSSKCAPRRDADDNLEQLLKAKEGERRASEVYPFIGNNASILAKQYQNFTSYSLCDCLL